MDFHHHSEDAPSLLSMHALSLKVIIEAAVLKYNSNDNPVIIILL